MKKYSRVVYLLIPFFSISIVVSCLNAKASNGYKIEYNSKKTTVKIFYDFKIKDYTPIIDAVLDSVSGRSNVCIEFEKGVYHFYPEKANSKHLIISNNDSGIKRIVFNISGFDTFEINGGKSDFIFYGKLLPFQIEKSTNVSLHNFTVNWDSPFVFEGLVVNNNSNAKSFDVKIASEIKYKVTNNELFFSGYDWSIGLGENIVYNLQTRRPYYYTSKYEHNWKNNTLQAQDLGNRIVRLSGTTAEVPPIGSLYIDKGPHGQNRLYPAIFINQSKNINLSSIDIYHSGAMALIAQKTNSVNLTKFNVILPPSSTRMISASADATHFVNCKGLIKFDSCRFENMLDDATNVHGTYQVVDSVVSDNKLSLTSGHFQQNGFNLFSEGDTMALVDRFTLKTVFVSRVKKYKVVNDTYFVLETENPILIEKIPHRYVVENLSWKAALTMRNCIVKQNRARSVLVSTTKPVLIENNYFSSMMAGIRICGDANYWFESGEVNQVIIRKNTFEDIGIGGHSPQAVLQIDPILKKDYRAEYYFHKNIIFENNIIKTFDPLIIYALSVDGLIIRNNEIISTNNYKPIYAELAQFDIHHCNHVLIQGNIYKGEFSATIALEEVINTRVENQKGFSDQISKKINTYFYQD